MAGDRDTSSLTVASTCERLVYFCVLNLHTQVLWPYESVLLTSQPRPLSMGAGRCVALWVENEQLRSTIGAACAFQLPTVVPREARGALIAILLMVQPVSEIRD